MEMEYTRISDIRADLKAGSLTLPNLAEHYLKRIAEHADHNSFLEVWEDETRKRAIAIQEKINSGSAGRLAGAIIAIKDNLCYKNHKVSASSKILEGFESPYTGTALQHLLDEDAIFIGRCNCDEFAMGSSNENSAFGPVQNPIDTTRVPGGSSGGSAAAVAADMCIAALGSDTGGSIRQPASFCGLVGLKPTYGRISRYGLIAYASSFDQIGPLTKSVADAELLYHIMAGKDERDSTTSSQAVETQRSAKKPLRIGYISECLSAKGMSPAIVEGMQAQIKALQDQGHTVEPVSFPFLDHMIPAYYVLTTAEASSNLARFDGIHYGYRSESATDIESSYVLSRTEGFGTEVKRRIMLGTFVLSAGYYDAYYSKAQKVRRLVKDHTDKLLSDYDMLMTPSAPTGAFGLNSVKDPIAMYLQDIFTVQANLAGVPAISIPLLQSEESLPVGLQLMAADFNEQKLFGLASDMMGQ
jgi:aspartyl-tRNA(Asn)/glutamyl-tRNA(Gln) amidotransferase subunit A